MNWEKATDSVLKACTGTFGRKNITFTPNGGVATVIKAILSREYIGVDTGKGPPLTSVHVSIGIRIADLPAGMPKKQDLVTIDTVDYRVIDVQEDGEGGATLMLHKK
jgi:hypothetical protein